MNMTRILWVESNNSLHGTLAYLLKPKGYGVVTAEDKRSTGLGLTNALPIFEARGGRIWADGKACNASSDCFTLPEDG